MKIQRLTLGFSCSSINELYGQSCSQSAASPAKGHRITRSVSGLCNLWVYCEVKQGIYSPNLFKGFETTALVAYHRGFKKTNSILSILPTYGV